MRRRTFIRLFNAATGASPRAWLVAQRMQRAEEPLESTTLSIEQIAPRVGYASAAVFREQFTRGRGVPPRDCQRIFSHTYARAIRARPTPGGPSDPLSQFQSCGADTGRGTARLPRGLPEPGWRCQELSAAVLRQSLGSTATSALQTCVHEYSTFGASAASASANRVRQRVPEGRHHGRRP